MEFRETFYGGDADRCTPIVERQLNLFERYLIVRVAFCMVVGVAIGQVAPGVIDTWLTIEFG